MNESSEKENAGAVTVTNADNWWNTQEIDVDHAAHWCLGPLHVAVCRLEKEWVVQHEYQPATEPFSWQFERGACDGFVLKNIQRFITDSHGGSIRVRPQLADRSIVSRPQTPLYILPKQNCVLYISTPLWFQLRLQSHVPLLDIPIQRPSDTWFGASTVEGELCYSASTKALLALDAAHRNKNRAVTIVTIRNRSPEPLLLERVNIPVSYLSLFEDKEGYLWTEPLTLTREEDAAVSVQMGKRAPQAAGPCALAMKPRTESEKNVLMRAFNALFG